MTRLLFTRVALAFLCVAPLPASLGVAQVLSQMSSNNSTASVKEIDFDVVSIKPVNNANPSSFWGAEPSPTPDGYRAAQQSLWATIMLAYYQTSLSPLYWKKFMLQGGPSWLMKNQYSFEAKVAPKDIKRWQEADPKREMLRNALQEMLRDQCKLVLHRVTTEQAVYALVVSNPAKLKLKKANPNEDIPTTAMRITNYGAIERVGTDNTSVRFYAMPMSYLVSYISAFGGTGMPIVDKTEMGGLYDFELPARVGTDDEVRDVRTFPWALENIGLSLKPIRAPMETLVIDHIEEPKSE